MVRCTAEKKLFKPVVPLGLTKNKTTPANTD